MPLLLVEDIGSGTLKVASANGKCTVTFLPGKPKHAQFFMNPTRRYALQTLHHVRQSMCWLQPRENMHMISNAADGMTGATFGSKASTQKLMHSGTRLRWKPILAIFGAPDEMVMQRCMGRGHGDNFQRPCRDARMKWGEPGFFRWFSVASLPSPPATGHRASGSPAFSCRASLWLTNDWFTPSSR